MGRWTDVAAWAGPIPNCGPGAMTAHMGVVIHTAEGSYSGTDAWQRNPAADVGSHFLTAKDGRVEQLIDTDIRSWCQSAGNDAWISIENEGFGSRGESLSPQQVENCARILAKANKVYGVPLQVSNSPSVRGLGWHGMGGAAWGGHTGCPGNAIRAQLPAIVARAAQIVSGTQQTLSEDDMPQFGSHEVKTGPYAKTIIGLPMSGAWWAGKSCALSFVADFGKAALRVAVGYDNGQGGKNWDIHGDPDAPSPTLFIVDSTKPRAGASIPVPARADAISIFRVPMNETDQCEVPVAAIVEIN